MNTLCCSEKIIQDCVRCGEEITFTITRNTQREENAIQRKVQILEFYIEELILNKERLAGDIATMSSVINRTEQTIKSLQYPKDTTLKCIEMRSTVPELRNDSVEKELNREIKLLGETETFLNNQLKDLLEQLRKHRSAVFSIESDLQRKTTTLKSEKQNDSIKLTVELERHSENNFLLPNNVKRNASEEISVNWQDVEWIRSTQNLLTRGKQELRNAQRLICFAEESLSSKTSALVTQYNRSNESFHKRITQCKYSKSNLEMELLNINELIHQVRQCIDETQNTIVANELQEQTSKIRLKKRISSHNPELIQDIVRLTLSENLQLQSEALQTIQKKFKMAQSSMTSLMKMKNQHEAEIEKKSRSIKIDEVECLPARSSIHYHAY